MKKLRWVLFTLLLLPLVTGCGSTIGVELIASSTATPMGGAPAVPPHAAETRVLVEPDATSLSAETGSTRTDAPSATIATHTPRPDALLPEAKPTSITTGTMTPTPTPSAAPPQSGADLAREGSWIYTSEAMYGGSISVLAISPNFANDQTLFAASGPVIPDNYGIFKSTDGGASWTWVFRDIPVPVVDMALSPNYAIDQTVLVATKMFGGRLTGIFLRSIDGGINWEYLNLCNAGTPRSVAFSPDYAKDQTMFLGNHMGWVCKSTDAGATWETTRPTTLPMRLAVSPDYAGDQTLFAAGDGILKSTDGGQTWDTSLHDWSRGPKTLAVSPHFATDGIVFVGTYDDGIYRTANAGESWIQVNDGLPHTSDLGDDVRAVVISPDFARDSTVFAVLESEGVFRSANGGGSWEHVDTPGTQVYTLVLSPDYRSDPTIFVGTDLGVFRSDDNGATWSLRISGITALSVSDLEVSPDFAADHAVFAGTWRGLFKSTDGAMSWSPIGFEGQQVDVELSPGFAADQTLFAGGNRALSKSVDAGESWNLVATKGVGWLVISPDYPNDSTLYAYAEGGGVSKSVDDGVSWTAMNEGLTSLKVSELAISPDYANDQTLFAGTAFARDEGGVFKSTDGGTSWRRLEVATHFNADVGDIAISPAYATDQTLFVGTTFLDNFLYKSTDGGHTWSTVHKAVRVNNIALSPNYVKDQTLFAGTGDGYGVLVSYNGGSTWAHMNAGLLDRYAAANDLEIAPTWPLTLFAGHVGVWQYSFGEGSRISYGQVAEGEIGLAADETDVYTFEGRTGDVAYVAVRHDIMMANLVVRLFDPDGAQVAVGTKESAGWDTAVIESGLTMDGAYKVRVVNWNWPRPDSPEAAAYTLWLKNTAPSSGTRLAYGDVVEGEMEPARDKDVYTFEAKAGDAALIKVAASCSVCPDLKVEVYDAEGNLVKQRKTYFSKATISLNLPKESIYTIVVQEEDNPWRTLSYELSLKRE